MGEMPCRRENSMYAISAAFAKKINNKGVHGFDGCAKETAAWKDE
jgi:hypothetical protein